ncbi:MAG: metal ABC transporter substrate-binding protein [Cyanobacteria bacterium P01_B01_bin.77]
MMFRFKIHSFSRIMMVMIATTSLLVSSCSPAEVNETAEQAGDDVSTIITKDSQSLIYVTNYPLKYFAERIGGDQVKVELPVPEDIDPAFWKPSVDELSQLQTAELIVLNGATYEKWLQTVSLPQAKTIETASQFQDRWLSSKEVVTHQHGPEGEHSHEGTAFTTWVDPTLAIEQAAVIRDRMTTQFPEQADLFATNYNALEQDLTNIDEQIATLVEGSTNQNQPLLASHPVYDYLAARYGLNLKNVLWEPETFPDQEQWAELESMLAQHPAEWMIWEGDPLPESVERLRQLGIESVVFDPAGNIPEDGDFLAVMQNNVENLRSVFAE